MKLISFEDIFSIQPPTPSIILVEGTAGTLKSALCFSLMINMLNKNNDKCGLYLTMEQNWQSHLKNMKSLGMSAPENLLVSDYNIMRKEFRDEETRINIFDSIISMVEATKMEKGDKFRLLALDSQNALYSIMDREYLDSATVSFFNRLRSMNMITLLIYERSKEQFAKSYRERFLADGIISLGIMHSKGDVIRYLQPLKLTGVEHSLKKRHLLANKEGLSLLGAVYK